MAPIRRRQTRGGQRPAARRRPCGDLRPTLTLLAASVAFVLLIACANVSNLPSPRSPDGLTNSPSGPRSAPAACACFRQTLLESLCLAVVGGTVGVALAVWGMRAPLSALPLALPEMASVGLNVRVCSSQRPRRVHRAGVRDLPSLRASRQDAVNSCADGARRRLTPASRPASVSRDAGGVTFASFVGAGLMGRSLARLWRVDPGFDPRGVVTFMTGLPDERAKDAARVRLTFRQVVEQVAGSPA